MDTDDSTTEIFVVCRDVNGKDTSPQANETVAMTLDTTLRITGSQLIVDRLRAQLMNDPEFNQPCVVITHDTIIKPTGMSSFVAKVVNGPLHPGDQLTLKNNQLIGIVLRISELGTGETLDRAQYPGMFKVTLHSPSTPAEFSFKADDRLKIIYRGKTEEEENEMDL